jgi:hypothetical protein
MGNSSTQPLISRLTNALKKASMVYLTLSVWTSGPGWNSVDIRGLTLMAVRNAFQIFDVNRESRFETISVGIPRNLCVLWANTSTRFSACFSCFLRGIKCAIFVKRSIMTQSWSHPSLRGRSVMKSIATDDHGKNSNSSSCNTR